MSKTQKIAYISVLSALSVLANIFTSLIPLSGSNYLSFVYLPCFLAGIYFGPLVGGAVGFFGDILGFLIAPPPFPFMPLITLATTLLGVIPALVWKFAKKLNDLLKLLISIFATTLICTAGLNTFSLWLYFSMNSETFDKTFFVYLFGRLPWQLIMIVVNGILIFAVLKVPYLRQITVNK